MRSLTFLIQWVFLCLASSDSLIQEFVQHLANMKYMDIVLITDFQTSVGLRTVENWMEAYHHIGPHLESVQPTNHAKDSYVSGDIDAGWSVPNWPAAYGGKERNSLDNVQAFVFRGLE